MPGFVCCVLFKYIVSDKKDNKSLLIMSCVISYLLLSFVSLLRIKYFQELPDTPIINSVLSVIIGVLFTIILAVIYNNKYFKIITVTLFHKTPHNDIWRDVLDFEKGSNLKIYLKDKDYYIIGKHFNHEENGNDSWLALKSFAKIDKITNDFYANESHYENNDDVIITVRFSDIEQIVVF